MDKITLIAQLSCLKCVPFESVEDFIEDSFGETNIDDIAHKAYLIGHSAGFNEGIETTIKFIEEHVT